MSANPVPGAVDPTARQPGAGQVLNVYPNPPAAVRPDYIWVTTNGIKPFAPSSDRGSRVAPIASGDLSNGGRSIGPMFSAGLPSAMKQ